MTAVKITENERQVLNALAGSNEPLRPYQMRYKYPATLGQRSDAGLHRTGASLARKGLADKRAKESGVAYSITASGRTALSAANKQKACPACLHPDRVVRHTCGLKGLQAMLTLPGPRR